MEPIRLPALAILSRASFCMPLCMLAVTLSLCGCGTEAEREDAPPILATSLPKKPVIALVQGRLTVDGQSVNLPGPVVALEDVLAAPSRREALAASVSEPAVNVYIWDQHGIVAVERPDLAQVTKVSLSLEAAKASSGSDGQVSSLAPTSTFPGSLSIDGVSVHAETTPAQLNDALDGSRFQQLKTFPHSWNMPYGAWTITAITDPKGERLVEISIGD